MSLPSLIYDINTDASGDGEVETGILTGWLTEVQVNHFGNDTGTLTVTAEFNGVTDTILDSVTGNTDSVYHVTRPYVDKDASATSDPALGLWYLSGQKLTCTIESSNGVLTPAIQIKFGGTSR